MIRINLYRDRATIDGDQNDIDRMIAPLSKAMSYVASSAVHVRNAVTAKLKAQRVGEDRIRKIIQDMDGKVKLFNVKNLSFPPGMVYTALKLIRDSSVDVRLVKHMENIDAEFNVSLPTNVILRKYQEEATDAVIEHLRKYHFAMVNVATGGGKTIIAANILSKLGLSNMLFVVPSKLLLWQVYEDFCKWFGKENIGIIGDGKSMPGLMITVATIQSMSLSNNKNKKNGSLSENDRVRLNVLNNAKVLAVDEVHRIPADKYYSVVAAAKNSVYVCGFTATPRRKDGGDVKIHAASGDVVYDIGLTDLIDMGYLTVPMIYFSPVPMRELDDEFDDINAEVNFYKNYKKYYNHQVIENDEATEIIANRIIKAIDEKRHVLVSINRIAHGNSIMERIPPFYDARLVCSDTKGAWDEIRAFKEGQYPVLISTLCSEGFDAPIIDNIIIAQDTTDSEQIIGRGARLYEGKKVCRIDHMYHDIQRGIGGYLRRHAVDCRNIYVKYGLPIMRDMT